MSVTLKASTLKKYDRLMICKGWVSNGHWAIRLSAVDNAAMFADRATAQAFAQTTVSEYPDGTVEKVLPIGTLYALTDTGLSYAAGTRYGKIERRVRVFSGPNGYQGFDESVLSVVGLIDRTLYQAKHDGPVVDAVNVDDVTACAMGYALHERAIEHLAPLTIASAA